MSEKLPYTNSQTNPHLAKGRIEKILMKFNVSQINFGEDYDRQEIRVSFVFKEIPVTIPINYKDLAIIFLEQSGHDTWEYASDNKKQKNLGQAKNAAFASIEDYLKAMLTMHQLGIMSIEEIFLPNIAGRDGIRLIEKLRPRLSEVLNGKLLIQ